MSSADTFMEIESGGKLATALQCLLDTDQSGKPRYLPPVAKDVRRWLLWREYSKPLLLLCHFIRAASNLPGGYFRLCWRDRLCRSSLLQSHFALGLHSSVRAESTLTCRAGPDGVVLPYPDAPDFILAYGAMPRLVALLDVLTGLLPFERLQAAFGPLAQPALTRREVVEQSDALSRDLYAVLKDQLPAQQLLRRFHRMVRFLRNRGGGDFQLDDIDDRAILDFWSNDITGSDGHLITFVKVFDDFARLRQVLGQAETLLAIQQAASIGGDRKAGEFDAEGNGSTGYSHQGSNRPAALQLASCIVSEEISLDMLTQPPLDRVKFFKNTEHDLLSGILRYGPTGNALCVSVMRYHVFGATQAKLTNAQRSRATPEALRDIALQRPVPDYSGWVDHVAATIDGGRRTLAAVAHILVQDGLVSAEPGADGRLLFTMAQQGNFGAGASIINGSGDELLKAARQAARKVDRTGLRVGDARHEDVQEAYRLGAPLVAQVVQQIEDFLVQLSARQRQMGGCTVCESVDHATFTAAFARIYGFEGKTDALV